MVDAFSNYSDDDDNSGEGDRDVVKVATVAAATKVAMTTIIMSMMIVLMMAGQY